MARVNVGMHFAWQCEKTFFVTDEIIELRNCNESEERVTWSIGSLRRLTLVTRW